MRNKKSRFKIKRYVVYLFLCRIIKIMIVQAQKTVLHKNLQDASKKLTNREEKLEAQNEKIKEYENEIKRLTQINFELEKKT